jgi:hypothetical protein
MPVGTSIESLLTRDLLIIAVLSRRKAIARILVSLNYIAIYECLSRCDDNDYVFSGN